MEFEWNEDKRRSLLAARGLDLVSGWRFFDGRPVVSMLSPRGAEERWKTTARIEGHCYTLVWTWRGRDVVRLISIRRAWNAEERAYREAHGGGA